MGMWLLGGPGSVISVHRFSPTGGVIPWSELTIKVTTQSYRWRCVLVINQSSQGDSQVSLVQFLLWENSPQMILDNAIAGRDHVTGAELWEIFRSHGIRLRKNHRAAVRSNPCTNPLGGRYSLTLWNIWILPSVHSSTGAIRKGFQPEGCNVKMQCHWSSKSQSSWAPLDAVSHWLVFPCGQRASLTDGEAAQQLPRDGDCIWKVALGKGRLPGFDRLNCYSIRALLQRLEEAELK